MRGSRRGLCACRHVKRSSFAGAGAKTRSTSVNTGAHDSDSAPAYARREPSQSRSEVRRVHLARSSSAAALPSQAAQGYPVKRGATPGAAFFWFLFLAAQAKELAAELPPAIYCYRTLFNRFAFAVARFRIGVSPPWTIL